MEDLQISSESNQIEARVQQTNVLKREMVCQVVKLQEELHLRSQLQYTLEQLSFKLKSLKNHQYDLEKQRIDFAAQNTQLLHNVQKEREQTDCQEIKILHLDKGLAQKLNEIGMYRERLRRDSQQLNQLSVRSNSRAHLSKENSSQLQMVEAEIEHSKQLMIRKVDLISKLQSNMQYYSDQISKIKKQILQKQAEIVTAQNKNKAFNEAIEAQKEKQNKISTDILLSKKDEDCIEQEIKDKKIKNKLMKQKMLILQNRVKDAQKMTFNYQNYVCKKRQQTALRVDRRKDIISNWFVNNHKWRIDLEYSRRYCNELSSSIN